MARVDPCVVARQGIMCLYLAHGRRMLRGKVYGQLSSGLLGVNVTSRPNKDGFEPTSDPSMSDMTYVGSYPTLLVESESHQHINSSVKCISTARLTLLREVRTKACEYMFYSTCE